jgi:peptidoglycan-N-acetylglucosamine deacetylase
MAPSDIVPDGHQLRQRRAAGPLDSNEEESMAKKEIMCTIGIDVDAVAGWLGSYGGEDSPCDITRGLFAGEIGSPRLLKMLDHYDLRTTWFIPGHSIETFPRQMQMVADAGHEIGLHGYSHENPVAMTPEQEETVLNKCIDLIERFSGRRPTGYVAPWWELSAATVALLLKNGIVYDHSRMDNDFHPFYARVGDTWTKIDYAQAAETWMKPLVRGEETDLVEIGANWYVDDLPPMMFIKKAPNSHGFVNPRHLEEIWRDQFDWVYREYEYAVFPITIHPDVSGRPPVLLMLERLIDYITGHEGVRWATFAEIAADFRERYPRSGTARPESVIEQWSTGQAAD